MESKITTEEWSIVLETGKIPGCLFFDSYIILSMERHLGFTKDLHPNVSALTKVCSRTKIFRVVISRGFQPRSVGSSLDSLYWRIHDCERSLSLICAVACPSRKDGLILHPC